MALAQVYEFRDTPIPDNKQLNVLNSFFVYGKEDSPAGRGGGEAQVTFEGMEFTGKGGGDVQKFRDYVGVELSLMRFTDFWSIISPQKFCCNEDDIAVGLCSVKDTLIGSREKPMYRHGIEYGPHPARDRQLLSQTGVYVLTFSNCGDKKGGTISGKVVVKNPYGYLPGSEYPRMPFYGYLTLAYMFLSVVWFAASLRWNTELIKIQMCIAGVIFLGFLECVLWHVHLHWWNTYGYRIHALFFCAIVLSVVKCIVSYMLVLVASLGWGVVRATLEASVVRRIRQTSIVYTILDTCRLVVLNYGSSHAFNFAFVLMCLFPVSLLNAILFYWIFTSLSALIMKLRARKQTEKLLLFTRLWNVLVMSLIIAAAALIYQITYLSQNVTARWQSQWLLTDGISHLLFLFVLVAIMWLWAPHRHSQRYAYSHELPSDVAEKDTGPSDPEDIQVWAEEIDIDADSDEDDVHDDDSMALDSTASSKASSRVAKPAKKGTVVIKKNSGDEEAAGDTATKEGDVDIVKEYSPQQDKLN
ncbi:unnamed protein product [Vitrella brassicaformis CCMP3155]|uniref:GOST seven transmembrane domain-containing protein n=2 Tax=Vitrella brassicaformis TaxID=1169539 RepID=A0A0G4FQB1_VITBC|nr:unnamed protein product [Vitrella brassicaformis CCMP3155]|eukprot:CEM16625.1 unnamed protein product [Vitrella brassicaformis CCMP3155]